MNRLTKIQKWCLREVRRIIFRELRGAPADVFLIGSWARREIRPSSDMDIAIDPKSEKARDLIPEITEALQESTVPYRVEVVDLTTVDARFLKKVAEEGVRWKG